MSSELKLTNIKHPSSGSNNLVLASDGSVSFDGKMSYVTTDSVISTASTNLSGTFAAHLTRTFTVSSGKSATVIVTGASHGIYESSGGHIEGRITLSGASSATGIAVRGQHGSFDNYGGELIISQGFRVTTAGNYTVSYEVREVSGEVTINNSNSETSYLTITVFED